MCSDNYINPHIIYCCIFLPDSSIYASDVPNESLQSVNSNVNRCTTTQDHYEFAEDTLIHYEYASSDLDGENVIV